MPKSHGAGDPIPYWSDSRKRWIVQVELPRRASGDRRRREIRGRTKTECLGRLREARRDLHEGTDGDRRTTVAVLLERWLERGLPNLSPAARENTVWAAEHITRELGARKLHELSAEDVEDWLADLTRRRRKGRTAGYSRSTLARLHGTLTRALDWAQARGLVGRNVSKLVVTPTGPRAERRALTVEEARRLLDVAANDPAGPVIATGLLLGLRPGELIALRWEDVDLAEGTLTVGRYLKTRASRRTLKMPPRLTEILIRHSAEQMSRQDSTGLVFSTANGTAWDRANLRRALRRMARAARVPKMTVYELRHSMVSILSAAGIPLEQIADVAGHSSPSTTGSVYRHIIQPTIDAAATVMDEL